MQESYQELTSNNIQRRHKDKFNSALGEMHSYIKGQCERINEDISGM